MSRKLVNKSLRTPKSTGSRNALMTPDHPRWEEFVVRLEGPEGLDFSLGPEVNQARSRCSGGLDRPYARRILTAMGGIDVKGSLTYFEEHAGYCDCEILMNVDPRVLGGYEAA